jgi:hypothetical protein
MRTASVQDVLGEDPKSNRYGRDWGCARRPAQIKATRNVTNKNRVLCDLVIMLVMVVGHTSMLHSRLDYGEAI